MGEPQTKGETQHTSQSINHKMGVLGGVGRRRICDDWKFKLTGNAMSQSYCKPCVKEIAVSRLSVLTSPCTLRTSRPSETRTETLWARWRVSHLPQNEVGG